MNYLTTDPITKAELQAAIPPRPILILDQDPDFGDLLSGILRWHSYSVTQVTQLPDALRMLIAGHYQSILYPLHSAHTSAEVFYTALQRVRPRLSQRIIFLSDPMPTPALDAFLQRTGNPVLYTPLATDELLNALNQLLQPERPQLAKSIRAQLRLAPHVSLGPIV